jgi:GNAT superfamily N-acetyltransferase
MTITNPCRKCGKQPELSNSGSDSGIKYECSCGNISQYGAEDSKGAADNWNANNPSPKVGTEFISHGRPEHWGHSVLIMEKNGSAFARAYWYDDDHSVIYLDGLSVSDIARKHGIATKLQEIREEIGRELGATTSCLWVDKDSWMHDWYQRRGYKDWKLYKNEKNAIWMIKQL